MDTFVDVKPETTTSLNITRLNIKYFRFYITREYSLLRLLLNIVLHNRSLFRFLHTLSCGPLLWSLRLPVFFFVNGPLVVGNTPKGNTLVCLPAHPYDVIRFIKLIQLELFHRLIRWFNYSNLCLLGSGILSVDDCLHRCVLFNQGLYLLLLSVPLLLHAVEERQRPYYFVS